MTVPLGPVRSRAEGDQAVACSEVEDNVTRFDRRAIEHAIANLVQVRQPPREHLGVAAIPTPQQPLGPPIELLRHVISVSTP